MCNICKKLFCPPACPAYDGYDVLRGAAAGQCALCEAELYGEERVFRKGRTLLCAECAKTARAEDLAWLCGYPGEEAFFAALGLHSEIL